MENILQDLHDLEGVNGAILADANGQVVAFRTHSMYDAALRQQVSRAVRSAVDSVKLTHEDWDSINVQFTEGRLMIRNLANAPASPSFTLTLIADGRLNPSFANVAIRVAIGKLKTALQAGPPAPSPMQVAPSPPAAPLAGSAAAMPLSASQPNVPVSEVANSGLSWSGLGSSTASASGVEVADAAASAALTTCTKALAKCVGPMAKIFVKEAVRKLCPGRPFSKDMAPSLVAELAKQISNPATAAQFQTALLKSL
ncbi:MAG TPA: hypothetical protein VFQ61_06220 [Polyangiaceae bacterium]|nr:hypothetical protein [Polyangiaceae bacterium]